MGNHYPHLVRTNDIVEWDNKIYDNYEFNYNDGFEKLDTDTYYPEFVKRRHEYLPMKYLTQYDNSYIKLLINFDDVDGIEKEYHNKTLDLDELTQLYDYAKKLGKKNAWHCIGHQLFSLKYEILQDSMVEKNKRLDKFSSFPFSLM